jgi:hypothetical protein
MGKRVRRSRVAFKAILIFAGRALPGAGCGQLSKGALTFFSIGLMGEEKVSIASALVAVLVFG